MAVIDSVYVPNLFGRTSFPLQHGGYPIFYKKFNASDSEVVNIETDIITVENHFFKTGEPLRYLPLNGGSPISIDPASPGASGITTLPEIVYPIVMGRDTFRLAITKDLSISNSYVNITEVGIGTIHSLETFKNNSKCLISIDNIIQSPVAVKSTVGITSTFPTNSLRITVDSIEGIKVGTILKIGNEYVRVTTINYTQNQYGYDILLTRGLEVLGSDTFEDFSTISTASVMGGVYNINKGKIYFSSPPLEGIGLTENININDIDYDTSSFTLFSSKITDGTQVIFFSRTPPIGLESGKVYFIIKNFENNFSFALNYIDVTNKNKVEFSQRGTNDPVLEFQITELTSKENSSFQGRIFLKSNYDGNVVFDDISSQFNGITTSFELKVSGLSTVGIKSDNGVVLINNIFQYPESEESFYYEESGGATNILWRGTIHPDNLSGISSIKDYDVNVRGLPRGGIIIGYGLSDGINYQPQERAEGYVSSITPEGNFNTGLNGITDSISIGYSGSGYIVGLSTYYVYFQDSSGNRVSGLGTAIIENGKVSAISIIENVPEGTYDPSLTNKPVVYIDPPYSYENIPLIGSSSGIGALCSFDINFDGIVRNFKITNPGYGYSTGEILTPQFYVGNESQVESDRLKVLITETKFDDFSAWNLGKLRKLNDLSEYANGTRKTFTLTETINDQVNIISLEKIPGSEIDLAYNLLVFVNDILQIPEQSYVFLRGTKIRFTEAPPRGSSIKVYFYEGYSGDSILSDAEESVKKGDRLDIQKDLYNSSPKVQNARTVTDILSSDEVETEIYNRRGLSFNSDQFRSITFTPQKQDLIIGGEYVSKSRKLNKSKVGIFTAIGSENGTFSGVSTDFIGINTSVGTGIQIGDYIESFYTSIGSTVFSVGSNLIGISVPSSSPAGISTISVKIWRKIDVE